MKVIRKKQLASKRASAILCADIHLREDTPICRTDNFEETQWGKLRFISELQEEHDCIVLHSGDLFHHWKPSPSLLSKTIDALPEMFYTVYGNHDLPQHNIDLYEKCGVYTLQKAGKLNVLLEVHWGNEPSENSLTLTNRKICVWHTMTYKNNLPYPGCTSSPAKRLLKKYPQFDLIVTGDNHETFIEEYDNRILVNPGSMMRQTAIQIEHKPCVFLWYAETNSIEKIYLPIKLDVISRDHIDSIEKRESRISSFVSKLNTNYKTELSFEDNLKKFENSNQIRNSVMELVYKSLEK